LLVSVAALVAFVPAHAKADSPVLEFVAPGSIFPLHFTADGGAVSAALAEFDTEVHCTGSHGDGFITGPRATVSNYVFTGCETQNGPKAGHPCQSAGANAEEIKSGAVEADLVFISQAKHEVGMVLNPHGGTYLSFECGGEAVKAIGSFVSPVGPINEQALSFTAILSRQKALQVPNAYEGPNGEIIPAIPLGEREGQPAGTTGVELGFTIHPSAPLRIKAITGAEVEAKRHADEAAAAKKRQEEEAAAAKKRQEEERARAQRRAQHLAKALKGCRKLKSDHKRTRCETRAKKKFGAHSASRK
jgi:hypothetical protein